MPLPEAGKKELKKLGIRSAEDLRRTIEEQNIDIAKVTDNYVDYQGLADLLNQTERKKLAPEVHSASLSKDQDKTILTLSGNNLAIAQSLDQFPVAVINDQPVEIISANEKELKIQVNNGHLQGNLNQLKVALDPYAIVKMDLQVSEPSKPVKSSRPRPSQSP